MEELPSRPEGWALWLTSPESRWLLSLLSRRQQQALGQLVRESDPQDLARAQGQAQLLADLLERDLKP